MKPPSAGFLLDTQACVRWSAGTLPPKVVRRLQKRPRLFYSLVSPWEVVIKRKFIDARFTYQKFWALTERIDAQPLELKRSHLDRFQGLPLLPNHSCPFDRMLIAQALTENLTIVSGDMRFPDYEGLEILWN